MFENILSIVEDRISQAKGIRYIFSELEDINCPSVYHLFTTTKNDAWKRFLTLEKDVDNIYLYTIKINFEKNEDNMNIFEVISKEQYTFAEASDAFRELETDIDILEAEFNILNNIRIASIDLGETDEDVREEVYNNRNVLFFPDSKEAYIRNAFALMSESKTFYNALKNIIEEG